MRFTIKKVADLIAEGVLEHPLDGNHGEKHPKTSDYVREGIPFILVPDMVDGKVDLDNCNYITEKQAKTLRKGFSKTGDVLFTHKATIGKVAIVDTKEYPYIILTPQITYYRLKNESILDRGYLYYYFTSKPFQEHFKLFASSGGTRAYLGITAQEKLNIIYPELNEQKNIVKILSNYDDLIENNNHRIALLEKAAQELYKEWFVRFRFPGYENAKFENGLPDGWRIKKVKDVVKRLPLGKLYKECDVMSEGTVIVIDQSKEPYIGFHNDEPSHTANIDIPIIIFGDHSCKFQLMITPFSLSENVVPFVASNGIDTTYLYYLVKDLIETTEYKRHWTELVSKKVLLADYDIQKQFSEAIKSNLLLIESLKVQNRNLIKQRDLLLPRLMSGKLEV